MLASALLLPLLLSAAEPPLEVDTSAAETWRVYSRREGPSKEDRFCANRSENRWRVLTADGKLVIRRAEPETDLPSWAFRFRPQVSLAFAGGALFAGYPTESGSGVLMYLNTELPERKDLLHANVVHLRAEPDGSVLAFAQAEDSDRTDVYRVTETTGRIDGKLVGPLGPGEQIVPDVAGHLPVPKLLPFSGGVLLALDYGEDLGGGLWWAEASGARQRRLVAGNVNHIEPAPDGSVLALGCGATEDVGRVFWLKADGTHISVMPFGALDGMAHVVSPTEDGFLVVTSGGVWRLAPRGKPGRLAEVDMRFLIPNSVVILRDGTIYVGMNAFVLRLLKNEAGYEPEWLLPAGCAGLERRGRRCDCR